MADAQFAIDIAANMQGGAASIAELDALTEKLLAGGKNSDVLGRGISAVSKQLDLAKATASAARAELEGVQKTFAGLEREAKSAESAASKYAANAGNLKSEFDLNHLAKLRTEAARARSALESHSTILGKVRERSRLANAAEDQHANTLANLQKLNAHVNGAFARRAETLAKVQAALTQTGGPLGMFAGRIVGAAKASDELTGALGASRAQMIMGITLAVGMTAAVVALTVALVAGGIALTAWAIKQADAARATNLTREALSTLHPEFAKLPIDDLVSSTGLAEDRIYAMAESLRAAKVGAKALPDALRAAATAEAALGQDGVALLQKRMAKTGQSVKATAKTIEQQFGGIVQRKMLGLDAQSARLERNLRGLFEGVDIEPVLRGMSILIGLFDETTATGKALKFLIGGIFDPLFENGERAAQVVEAFALGVAIQLVNLYILAKPLIRKIKDLFGLDDGDAAFAKGLDMAEIAGRALAVTAVILTAALVTLGGTLLLLTAAPVAVVAAFMALGYGIAAGIDWAIGKLGELADWFRNASWGDIAKEMIAGFVNSLLGGAPMIINAVTGVFSDAVDAAKRVLGIHSPSKVTGEIADNTADGFINQMDRRAPEAHAALESAVAPQISKGSAADRGIGGSGTRRGRPLFENNTFNFYGVRDAEDAESRFEDLLTKAFEGDAASLSGDLDGVPA